MPHYKPDGVSLAPSGPGLDAALRRALDDVAEADVVLPRFEPHSEAPQPAQVLDDLGRRLRQRPAAPALVAQRQRAVAVAIEAHDLHVGDARFLRVLLCKELPNPTVTAVVVDAVDDDRVLVRVI